MSAEAIDWVLNHSETGSNAKLVLVIIAQHENGKASRWPTIQQLGDSSKLSIPTVVRAIKAAEELGELIVTRKHPNNVYILAKYLLDKAVKPKVKSEADLVCQGWWEASDPKPMPAGGFVGARKIIDKALKAGWTSEEVSAALPFIETLAAWSLEKALKENKRTNKPRSNPQKFDFWTGQ